jgi:nanoRNase/pAp phosphatase (c-di-AMP/oligoRNAs hydrolase)
MTSTKTAKRSRSDQLLEVLAGYEHVMVVMHDNPDPDAIATGWAILCLIEEKLGIRANLIAGGAIVRAENRHMVDLLGAPVQLVLAIDVLENTATVLVDCGLGAGNQLLTRDGIEPVAVIDHHPSSGPAGKILFFDVRPDVAASATIAASYLAEQQIEPGPKLATALWYAVRTETRGSEFRYSPLDHEILVWLTERAEPELLAEIESAPLAREYYADLVAALRETVIYRDAAFCLLPRAAGPEIVGEIADLLVRCQGVRSVFCAAVCDENLVVSVRTDIHGDNATAILQKTLAGQGGCGGHSHRAGGNIPHVGRNLQGAAGLCSELKARWLEACGIDADAAAKPLLTDGSGGVKA